MKSSVAVLMAAYEGERWISEQIQSIVTQKDVDVTLFISIDRSRDKTYSICEKWSSKYPNIKLLSYGQRYGSASANFYRLIASVNISTFDFVAFSDQDDIWLPKKLSKAKDMIEARKADAYSSNAIAFWEDGKSKLLIKSQKMAEYDYLFEAAGPGCTYVFRVEAFELLKQFLSINSEVCKNVASHDWFAYAFLRSRNLIWVIDENSNIMYRQHSKNEFGANYGMMAYMARLKKIVSGHYSHQCKLIYKILLSDQCSEKFYKKYYLLWNFRKLRRRTRDKYILFFLILTGFIQL